MPNLPPPPPATHFPQRPTERSDPTQHAKGRTGDCPEPHKETATRRNVTQGGGGGGGGAPTSPLKGPPPPPRDLPPCPVPSVHQVTALATNKIRAHEWPGCITAHEGVQLVGSWMLNESFKLTDTKLHPPRLEGRYVDRRGTAVAISRCGGLAFVGHDDGSLNSYSLEAPARPHRRTFVAPGPYEWPRAHGAAVTGLHVTAFNTHVVSAAADGYIRVWTLHKAELVRALHAGFPLHATDYSAENQHLVAACDDFSVRVFDVNLDHQPHDIHPEGEGPQVRGLGGCARGPCPRDVLERPYTAGGGGGTPPWTRPPDPPRPPPPPLSMFEAGIQNFAAAPSAPRRLKLDNLGPAFGGDHRGTLGGGGSQPTPLPQTPLPSNTSPAVPCVGARGAAGVPALFLRGPPGDAVRAAFGAGYGQDAFWRFSFLVWYGGGGGGSTPSPPLPDSASAGDAHKGQWRLLAVGGRVL